MRIGPLVAAFLLISAIAHAALASPRLHAWYERNLTRGIQPARWVEYSLSSLLMMVVIAMLVGIYDIASLFLIFALNAAMILFGWIMELHNQTTRRTNWNAYWFGCFAAAAAQRLAEICKALEQELVRGPEAWRPPSSRGSRRKTATIGPPSSRAGGGQDGRGAKFAAESEECGHPSRRATTARR